MIIFVKRYFLFIWLFFRVIYSRYNGETVYRSIGDHAGRDEDYAGGAEGNGWQDYGA